MIRRVTDTKTVEHLFGAWKETMIRSCLQGIMGEIYAKPSEDPLSAMAILGDFIFLAGVPDKEFVSYRPDWYKQDFTIMVPQHDEWGKLIKQCYKEKTKKVIRYAVKKEPHAFDTKRLKSALSTLPEEYEIKMIDETIYRKCKAADWSRDLVSQFENYELYHRLGLGVAILKDEEIVSGASSYSRYRDGIEIEIDTQERYRRKGFAYLCGAKLILECLDRNLYPSWDAQNTGSLALAEKLGYHLDHAYPAYEIPAIPFSDAP